MPIRLFVCWVEFDTKKRVCYSVNVLLFYINTAGKGFVVPNVRLTDSDI